MTSTLPWRTTATTEWDVPRAMPRMGVLSASPLVRVGAEGDRFGGGRHAAGEVEGEAAQQGGTVGLGGGRDAVAEPVFGEGGVDGGPGRGRDGGQHEEGG